MKKFKIGDTVTWNGNTENSDNLMFWVMRSRVMTPSIHTISLIDTDGTCQMVGDTEYWYSLAWFDKVKSNPFPFNMKKNDFIMVTNYRHCLLHDINCTVGKFYKYDPELKRPFLMIDNAGNITNWMYGKPVSTYIPYTKPQIEWRGKYAIKIDKNRNTVYSTKIEDFRKDGKDWIIIFEDGIEEKLTDCFDRYKWLDSSIFGEQIDDKYYSNIYQNED